MSKKCAGLEHVLTFGKYRGKTVKEVLYCDPSYLVWAHENIYWFNIQDDIYKKAINEVFDKKMYNYVRREFNFHHFYDDDVYEPF